MYLFMNVYNLERKDILGHNNKTDKIGNSILLFSMYYI